MDEESPAPPASQKPSQIPSWVTLGFVLGALFILALPRHDPPAPEPARPEASLVPATPPRRDPPLLTTIEAVFAAWDRYAVWSDGTTQVALWSAETKQFSECYEVIKSGDGYYFRSIPRLTRPILTHGVVPESPLQFTETERQRREWLTEIDKANLRAISDGMRESLGPPPEKRPDTR